MPPCLVLAFLSIEHPKAAQKSGISQICQLVRTAAIWRRQRRVAKTGSIRLLRCVIMEDDEPDTRSSPPHTGHNSGTKASINKPQFL